MKRGTPDHPKIHNLAELLKIPWLQAVGLLEVLFHATMRYAPAGNIGKWPDEAIVEQFRNKRWNKQPSVIIEALLTSGWLDRDPEHRLIVHDWDQHADGTVRKWLKYNKQEFIKPATEQLVYFVRSKHTRQIKIGLTGRHDQSRFHELQRNSPEPLELLAEVPGGFVLESELQKKFEADRIRGEWFRESDELLSVINELMTISPENIRHCSFPKPEPLPLPEPLPDTKPEPEPSDFRPFSGNGKSGGSQGILDEYFSELKTVAEQWGAACIPEDWVKAQFAWRVLDFGQRAQALANLKARIERGDDPMYFRPQKYLQGEWRRQVIQAKPRQSFKPESVAYLEAELEKFKEGKK